MAFFVQKNTIQETIYMSVDLFCLIVDADTIGKDSCEDVIKLLGFEVIENFDNVFSVNDPQSHDDLLIQKIGNKYLLLGFSLHKISNKILTRKNLEHVSKNCLTLHLVHQSIADKTFFIGYFENGRPGPSNQVIGTKKKSWGRTFTQDQLPVPHSPFINKSIQDLSNKLEADYDLLVRIYRGMHGKGNYGLGYHPDCDSWVACKKGIVADDSELQEIDQHSYRKKKEPFNRTTHPNSQESFLNQTDLSAQIHQRTIENLIGFKIDTISQQSCSSKFGKFKVNFIE